MELISLSTWALAVKLGCQARWQVPSLTELFDLPWSVLGFLFCFFPLSMLWMKLKAFLHARCVTTELHQSTKLADLLNNLPKAIEVVWNWNLNLGLVWFWNPAVCDSIWPFVFVWVQLPFWSFFGRTVLIPAKSLKNRGNKVDFYNRKKSIKASYWPESLAACLRTEMPF